MVAREIRGRKVAGSNSVASETCAGKKIRDSPVTAINDKTIETCSIFFQGKYFLN